MMMPSIFREDLFDNFMEDFAFPSFRSFSDADRVLYGKHAGKLMKTDVKETEEGYEVDIDLPGFKKDEIRMQLENGSLTVSASRSLDKDEKNENGSYIRRERYAGSMSRSFFVGEDMKQEDIHARYESGVLTLDIPKLEARKPEVEEKKYIMIEG